MLVHSLLPFFQTELTQPAGQTDLAPGESSADGGSFLDRERAALGDDADFFATSGDNLASTVEDGGDDDEDLLGGGGNSYNDGANEGMSDFESSFPAIDTSNEVSFLECQKCKTMRAGRDVYLTANGHVHSGIAQTVLHTYLKQVFILTSLPAKRTCRVILPTTSIPRTQGRTRGHKAMA